MLGEGRAFSPLFLFLLGEVPLMFSDSHCHNSLSSCYDPSVRCIQDKERTTGPSFHLIQRSLLELGEVQ